MGRAYTTTGIEVQNSGGTTLLDTTGVISQPNFDMSGTTSSNFTTTSTSHTPMTNGTVTFVTDNNNARIAVFLLAWAFNQGAGTAGFEGWVGLQLDGVLVEESPSDGLYNPNFAGNIGVISTTIARSIEISSAGTHTLRVTGRIATGGTLSLDYASLFYILMGK